MNFPHDGHQRRNGADGKTETSLDVESEFSEKSEFILEYSVIVAQPVCIGHHVDVLQ